jgi:hypothetical protein
MSFTSSVATLATAATGKPRELPMPPLAFAAIAFACFLVLLGVLWSFRHTAAKYDRPARAGHRDSGDARGSYGATGQGGHH